MNKHHLEDIVDGFLSVVVCVVYCGRVFYLLDRKVLFLVAVSTSLHRKLS